VKSNVAGGLNIGIGGAGGLITRTAFQYRMIARAARQHYRFIEFQLMCYLFSE